MKLGEIYRTIVEMGIDADPRGKEKVDRVLAKSKEKLDKLTGIKKELADKDVAWNPYTDCRLLYGEEDREIGSVLAGIDISPGEIALAELMEAKDEDDESQKIIAEREARKREKEEEEKLMSSGSAVPSSLQEAHADIKDSGPQSYEDIYGAPAPTEDVLCRF